jgi:hypothetical protein
MRVRVRALLCLCLASGADALAARGARPVAATPRPRARPLAAWAGESAFKSSKLFSSANIPRGVPPAAFYAGLGAFVAANLGVVGLVALDRLGLAPPINALTDIANAAMDDAVRAGTLPPALATFWAQSLWTELLGEYLRAGLAPQDFIAQWCESDPVHTAWCTTAKEVAQARAAAL